jgi:hypothetical protein
MNWLAVTTTLISAWAVLRVLGGERQRLVQELPPEPEPAPEPEAPAAAPVPPPAKGAKPAPPNRKPR